LRFGSDAAISSKPRVTVRIPGSQRFTSAQTDAIRELVNDIDANGFEAKFPIVKTANLAQAVLDCVELYFVYKAGQRIDKGVDHAVEKLIDITTSWAKRQFTTRFSRTRGDEPRKTQIRIIYGPDGKPLKMFEVEVFEDDDS
jgi:hypothetical protein